jgi:RimJ/RimL family protein N-acetyltransferase
MRHSLTIDGPAFRLRPVRPADAAFIAQMRADPERSRYLHRGRPGASAQEQWLAAYFERGGDYYFVVENRATSQPEGTVGVYNVGWSFGRANRLERDAEWGRWVLRRGSLAALESACLLYRLGFEMLDLDSIYCRTIVENASALAFHDSFGMERMRVLPGFLKISEHGGCGLDAMECRLTRARWMALRDVVEGKALRAAAWGRPQPKHAPVRPGSALMPAQGLLPIREGIHER